MSDSLLTLCVSVSHFTARCSEVHCNQCRAAHLPRAACPAVSAETIAQANALFLSGQELLLNSPDHLFSDAVSYQSAPSSSLPSTHPNFSSSTQPSSSSSSSFSFQPASSPTSSSSAQPSSCSTSSALASRSSLPGSIFQSTALTPAMLDIDPGAGTRTRYSDFEVRLILTGPCAVVVPILKLLSLRGRSKRLITWSRSARHPTLAGNRSQRSGKPFELILTSSMIQGRSCGDAPPNPCVPSTKIRPLTLAL